jgi:hypothetical protein
MDVEEGFTPEDDGMRTTAAFGTILDSDSESD